MRRTGQQGMARDSESATPISVSLQPTPRPCTCRSLPDSAPQPQQAIQPGIRWNTRELTDMLALDDNEILSLVNDCSQQRRAEESQKLSRPRRRFSKSLFHIEKDATCNFASCRSSEWPVLLRAILCCCKPSKQADRKELAQHNVIASRHVGVPSPREYL